MILAANTLIELTGKVKRPAQARVLSALGIPYRRRPDGTIVVFEHDLPHATTQAQPRTPKLRLP
jgi:hypothetical protein